MCKKIILFFIIINVFIVSSCRTDNQSIEADVDTSLMQQYPFGNSALSIEERVADLVGRLTIEEKISLLHELAPAIPRLGIKKYYHGNECLHGVVRPGKSTVFPQAIAFGAAWDPDLIFDVATAISDEARAKHHSLGDYPGSHNGLLTFWSPTVNMARDPRWGRTAETYGEDPFLTARTGVEFVKGIQGDDPRYLKAVSTPKHFVGNNEEHNRFRCQTDIDMFNLRNYYLPAFKALITEGNAQSIMGAYNAIFGVPCNLSKFLLSELLRDEWGFDGYAVTDCGGIEFAHNSHNYVSSYQQAAAESFKAGIDLECGGAVRSGYLLEAYRSGQIGEDVIDRAAENVLRARFKLGLFDPDEINPYSRISASVVGCDRHSELAYNTAVKSFVLLKNAAENGQSALPLNNPGRIAVIGPNADSAQFGDYSGIPLNQPVSPLQGIRKEFASSQIDFVKWVDSRTSGKFNIVPVNSISKNEGCSACPGFVREYYSSWNFKGTKQTATDFEIDYNFRSDSPDPRVSNASVQNELAGAVSSEFSVRWKGYLRADISGKHVFRLNGWGYNGKRPVIYFDKKRKLGSTFTVNLEKGRYYQVIIELPKGSSGLENHTVIKFEWKLPASNSSENNFSREIEAARKADTVIAVLGLGKLYEMEGTDRSGMNLPKRQLDMIKAFYDEGIDVVAVLINGSPISSPELEAYCSAILECWYPGERGGDAIAAVLSGREVPSGKLPLTIYRDESQLPPFNSYDITKGRTYMYFKGKPLYPFGYGLSYTTFEYLSMKIMETVFSEGQSIPVELKIKNTGDIAADEIVQIYFKYKNQVLRDNYKMPEKMLKGFKRVSLAPGEEKTLTIYVSVDSLKWYSADAKDFILLKDEVLISAASNSEHMQLSQTITIQ
jgi:beta-glucosidase